MEAISGRQLAPRRCPAARPCSCKAQAASAPNSFPTRRSSDLDRTARSSTSVERTTTLDYSLWAPLPRFRPTAGRLILLIPGRLLELLDLPLPERVAAPFRVSLEQLLVRSLRAVQAPGPFPASTLTP